MKPSKLTGSMIRSLREKLGWTRPELAEKMGISEGSLRNYEQERRPYKKEPVQIPLLLDWALSALSSGLKPFSESVARKGKK